MWGNALYFKDYRGLENQRELLILAALLDAAGDADGARASLRRCLALRELSAQPTRDRIQPLAASPAVKYQL